MGLLRTVIQRVDQRLVALLDEAAAYLLGARNLAVVGVELLVEDQEALDLCSRHHRLARQRTIDLGDMLLDQIVDAAVGSKLLIGSVDHIIAFGPVADGSDVDVDEAGDEVAVVAVGHCFADIREEFQLVLDVFRGKQRAVLQFPDIFRAIDDLEVSVGVEETRIPGLDEAVRGHGLGSLLGFLEIAEEHTR